MDDEQKQDDIPPKEELAARLAKGRRLGAGSVAADQWGLVTIEQMRLLKGAQRVVIERR
jgi:hypothetical protein